MNSFWTDLLFLHGHIHDGALARRLYASRTREPRSADKRREPIAQSSGFLFGSACGSLLGNGRRHAVVEPANSGTDDKQQVSAFSRC